MVRIRRANYEDKAPLFEFLRTEWSENHIFLSFQELFEWQHREGRFLNFIIAEDQNGILGCLGYIPSNRWSGDDYSDSVSLAIWKVSKRIFVPGLGLKLLSKLEEVNPADRILAIGVNAAAIEVYKLLGFKTGVMAHFAVGPRVSGLRSNSREIHRAGSPTTTCAQLDLSANSATLDKSELKEFSQIRHILGRFGSHPAYEYEAFVWGKLEKQIITIHRIVKVSGTTLSRVVYVAGDREILADLAPDLEDLAESRGWDYIDLVCFGHDPKKMDEGGFVDRFKFPDLVLPHHFEPFENKNVDLAFAVKSNPGPIPGYFYLADSDQDRPNELPQGLSNE